MNHIARKRFGQNFLQDPLIIDRMIHDIAPQANQTIAEIGPGLGALTLPLLTYTPDLHIIEIDRDLAAYWRVKALSHLTVIEIDALQFDFSYLAKTNTHNNQLIRIVGNLPYNISSPLLFHLQKYSAYIQDQYVMLQREVVDRIVAKTGDSEFSRLSVMLQATYDITHLHEVPPTAFDPQPQVWSAVIRMVPLKNPIVDRHNTVYWHHFSKIVAQAFSQRRKMLRSVLKEYTAELEQVGIYGTMRAQEVSVKQFAQLAHLISLSNH